MPSPHLTKKKAKELSITKGEFLLTFPNEYQKIMFYSVENLDVFKNCCPLCELFLDGKKYLCSDECPIFNKSGSCFFSDSLWQTYQKNLIPLSGDIYPKGKEALEKLVQIVKEWDVRK